MSFETLIPLVGAVLNGTLAIFVLLQNPRAAVTRVYFLMGMSFAVWNYGTYWMFKVQTAEEALFWARFLQFGVIWIPLTLCHVSFLVARIALPRGLMQFAYGLHGLLFLSNFTGFFLSGVKNVGYAWYSVAGTGFWILSGVFSLMWVSVYVLLQHRGKQPPMMRRRLTALIFAQAAFALFGCNDILPIIGIYNYPFTEWQVYPFGSMAVIFYGMIVGYGVLQHQLLDVHVVLSRYAAHAVRMLFLMLTGFCLLLLLAALAPEETFTPTAFLGALGVLLASSIVAGTVFPRLLGGHSESFERRLLGDRFEYQDQVRSFIQSMTWYGDLDTLLNELHALLVKTFRTESYKIVLRDETTHAFSLARAHPDSAARQLPELKSTSPVFQYFEWGEGEYLSLSSHHLKVSASRMAREAREQLAPFEAEFCFPLAWQNEPFGLLLVGPKSSGDPYTATDISLLVSLAKNMSTVANQIRLKTQILQAQELDLLGRMSRGMAHDLNNLLTPVSTLLQLQDETGILDEELLPVAARNVATMRAYIKEALFFSENLRPDFQVGALDSAVRQAIEVAQTSRTKPVEVRTVVPGAVHVEVDTVLIQRLIANLVTNAIDASPPRSQVLVVVEYLARNEPRDWVRVRVIDEGDGIAREDLDRVLTPYFTTKNRGDGTRGFGLGLAICRKIAALHGGNLSIESRLKKGTTVQLDLPCRQNQLIAPPSPLTPSLALATP